MVSFNTLIAVCLVYVVLLFLIAFIADQRARRGRLGWLRSPLVYTLSLSIYCTAWTFYGAVGYAARSGLEFVTIYLGPTLVMVGWWWILRKLVRIGRTQRITSIADLISSRYGKSNLLGVIVTLMAVIGTTPYIALQLQSVTLSFAVFSGGVEGWAPSDLNASALWVAAGLALFTVLFGTRNLDANERHYGVVTAIAVEAVMKLFALIAVGVFVVWGIADGASDILARIDASSIATWDLKPGRWVSLIFLSAVAFLTLPRMFQVMVVENADERHLATASWAFPLYLFLMSLFVMPIAVVGLDLLPAGSNPDLFVLTVPLSQGRDGLAMLSFLGGFSSATSMVIVAAIALSTMVSNHIVMPLWLNIARQGATISGDVRQVVLTARRVSIAGILALGYAYYRISGGGAALAAIGLISFVGVAQFLPAILGGIFWRGATRIGAAAGLITGFCLWAYTLFLPSFGGTFILSASVLAEGPLGIGWLRPQALFGVAGMDPLVHALFWSMTLNVIAFCAASLASFPTPQERLQGAQFVNVFAHSGRAQGWAGGAVEAEDLLVMAQRIMGPEQAQRLFQRTATRQGKAGYLPDTSPDFLQRLERELAGSVGAATAHAMVGQIVGGASVSVGDLMAVADETAQMMEYSSQLEAKSAELGRTARALREVNEKLTDLSVQKDAFLGQISHELRTPMTSIRAFSEILREGDGGILAEDQRSFLTVIKSNADRLTMLVNDLLDISRIESGRMVLSPKVMRVDGVVNQVVTTLEGRAAEKGVTLRSDVPHDLPKVIADPDRVAQIMTNLVANAYQYTPTGGEIVVSARAHGDEVHISVHDTGIGIAPKDQ
ncbi:MAG: sodium:solute symporter, partial [Marinosulfonomonas sp.]|nr:sodium:solute symporter [Marinosulfonomonas sp.]